MRMCQGDRRTQAVNAHADDHGFNETRTVIISEGLGQVKGYDCQAWDIFSECGQRFVARQGYILASDVIPSSFAPVSP
jgi:hypothetical protein